MSADYVVSMLLKFDTGTFMTHCIKEYLHAFSANKLEGWNKVAVPSDNDYGADKVAKS